MSQTWNPGHLPLWLRAAALLLLVAMATLVALIAAGVFDPQPAGLVSHVYPLQPETAAAGDESIVWVAEGAGPQTAARTWQLEAAHASGEADTGYGLGLGDEERSLVVAVSPLGYAAVWERDGAGEPTAVWLPWQTWPHVAGGNVSNEIWVDIEPQDSRDLVRVRINRELLWAGEVDDLAGGAGLWLASFGGETAVDFQRLTQFDQPATD